MTRGGPRPGAGRKPRGPAGPVRRYVSVHLLEHEEAAMVAVLEEGETLPGYLRDLGLREAARRANRDG